MLKHYLQIREPLHYICIHAILKPAVWGLHCILVGAIFVIDIIIYKCNVYYTLLPMSAHSNACTVARTGFMDTYFGLD